MKMIPRIFYIFATLCILNPMVHAQSDSHDYDGKFTPRALRGYGTLSAQLVEGAEHSVLKVQSETEAQAALTQAKYISDLTVLPGVSAIELEWGDHTLHVYQVTGQGIVSALRKEDAVWIFAAASQDAFAQALEAHLAEGLDGWTSISDVAVPMWLDRWDRFGYRFYYREWGRPEGVSDAEYNFLDEFAYAEAHDRTGFVFWEKMSSIDTAEGLNNSVFLSWARREARQRSLPVGLNAATSWVGSAWMKNGLHEHTQQKMPHFTGSFHRIGDAYSGGNGFKSWNSDKLTTRHLAGLKQIMQDYVQDPNLTTILEPHGELRHGHQDLFLEYGAVADAGYRRYLTQTFGDVKRLNQRWGTNFSSMDEVRVPEVASFLGWGAEALDLAGMWKIAYEPLPEGESYTMADNSRTYTKDVQTLGAPDDWFAADFDDAAWGDLEAPKTDQVMFIQKRPAVLRQTIEVPADWLQKHEKVWLYLWDMNRATHGVVKVALNGEMIAEEPIEHNIPHWTALEVSNRLQAGDNALALRLPQAMIAYRVYLSPKPPQEYPHLGTQKNAQWVDFIDWIKWSRVEVARKSMNMIRQVTPNHQITMMAPDGYADAMLALAKDYGGNFHNTGYMGAFWADYLPALMRGADLPFSLEPGSPANDLTGYKKQLGRYFTEGLQGIDYFIHIGSIIWKDELRNHFEQNLKAIKLLGKYHAPKAEIAAFYSTDTDSYTSYPWSRDLENLKSGYWNWNWRAYTRGIYESDAVAETSFDSDDVDNYKVIIDSNTSVIDEDLLEGIEAYVREGGVFVTFVQTGRHTPIEPNSWPISKLTGFKVSSIDPLKANGREAVQPRGMYPAAGEEVFHGDWSRVEANGLSLEPVASDARALMYWKDGSVAIGVRALGEGLIVQMGCKFDGIKMSDRLDPHGRPLRDAVRETRRLFSQLLDWQNIQPIASSWQPENENILLRHFITNNGLYDVWVLWNQSENEAISGQLAFPEERAQGLAYDLLQDTTVSVRDGFMNVALEPLQSRVFLTQRMEITKVPARWLALQRDWWRMPLEPEPDVYEASFHPNSVGLGKDWGICPLSDSEFDLSMVEPSYNDSDWGRLEQLGIWSTIPEYRGVDHALLRKQFTVPAEWTDGSVELGLHSWWMTTFMTSARMWLDGQQVQGWSNDGIINANPFDLLQAGTTHVLAVEIKSDSVLAGSRGTAWLWHQKAPDYSIDLSGQWQPTQDSLRYDEPIEIPGAFKAMQLRRTVEVPAAYAGKRVHIGVAYDGGLEGVLVNGRWLMRFHHQVENRFELDVTPWIEFGAENVIELSSKQNVVRGHVKFVTLNFYSSEEED